jgi:hypothetical protein
MFFKNTCRICWVLIAGTGFIMSLSVDTAWGQQTTDPTFKASVDKPAYVHEHPKALFDEGHFNVHTSQGTYKAYVDLLASDGYQIQSSNEPFDVGLLADYSILITSNARGAAQCSEKPAFTEQECDAVRDWVQAGGALLLVVDHYPTGHAAENLATRFHVDLSKGTTMDRANVPAGAGLGGAIPSHAITRDWGITRLRVGVARRNKFIGS